MTGPAGGPDNPVFVEETGSSVTLSGPLPDTTPGDLAVSRASLVALAAAIQTSADITPGSTFTGMGNTLPWALFLSVPPTRTNGQGGPLLADSNGNLLVSINTLIAGEDQTYNRMMTAVEGTYSHITTVTQTIVKPGPGVLNNIVVNAFTATATITIYDNTSGSGTKIAGPFVPVAGMTYNYGVQFLTGLTIVTAVAASDITVSYT